MRQLTKRTGFKGKMTDRAELGFVGCLETPFTCHFVIRLQNLIILPFVIFYGKLYSKLGNGTYIKSFFFIFFSFYLKKKILPKHSTGD